MKKYAFLAAVIAISFAAAPLLAAPKSYQVTGPVLEMSDDSITVQKGTEKWEIAKGDASIPEDVKVGSKVTVQYTMQATSVASKEGKHSVKASGGKSAPSPAAVH